MKRLIVVDVSNYIFRAFFAIRPLNAPDGTPVNAVYGVLSMFLKLLSQYRPTHILMAKDTAGGSFRNQMYEQYKANRTEPPDDLIPQFALIKELIEKMGLAYSEDENFEADDIIGSAVTQWKGDFDEILIASGDKDLMQFVGDNIKMLDTMKDKTYDAAGVFEKMGARPDQIVDYLSMVGDSSDNIPGMRGIGAKGAAKLLAEHDSLDKCIEVKDTFTGKKLTTAFSEHLEDGLLSRKLIKIVTDVDLKNTVDDVEAKFYPSDELISFLKGLGFNRVIDKLMDLRKAEYEAEQAGEGSFIVEGAQALSFDIKMVSTIKDFDSLKEVIGSHDIFSIHTEYDSGDIFDRKLRSLGIACDAKTVFYLDTDFSNITIDMLHQVLSLTWSQSDVVVASEHWKRDYFYASVNEIDVKAKAFDTTQVHYILDPGSKHDIGFLADEYLTYRLDARDKKDPFLKQLEKENRAKFVSDRAGVVFVLIEKLQKELKEKELINIYEDLDQPLISILSQMERQGVAINKEFFNEYEKELAISINEIEQEIAKVAQVDDVNLNSPKQVSELLFEKLELPVVKKTKTGYSTDSEVLETLDSKEDSKVPGLILRYRELGKLQSTYIKTLPVLAHESDGRIHTHFNQHVAATGRLASNNPNLQNIPIRTELGRKTRKGFIAKEGHLLLGADYSQIELRLLAHFSEDPTMLKAFNNGEDIHRQTASEILGIKLEEVDSSARSNAKAVNFGLMYGQSSFGLAAQLKISRKEAKEYITNYFEKFARVKSYLDTLKDKASESGYSVTFTGRKRFLPDLASKNRTVRSMAERVAINSPIQGSAADIIKMAMINIDKKIATNGLVAKMILQVHDELIFEVPEKEIDLMEKLVKETMESVVKFKVPLTVDVGIGKDWFDLK